MFNISNRLILFSVFIILILLYVPNNIIEGDNHDEEAGDSASGVDENASGEGEGEGEGGGETLVSQGNKDTESFYDIPEFSTPGSNVTCPVDIPDNTCELPPNVNSAVDACKAIETKKQEVKQQLESDRIVGDQITKALSPLTLLNNIADSFDGRQDVNNDVVSLIKSVKKTLSEQQSEQRCDNMSNSINENIANFNTGDCVANLAARLMQSGFDQDHASELASKVLDKPVHATNITQTVKDTKKEECEMNSVMSAIQNQGSSLASSALQSAMQDLKGVGHIKSDADACSGIDEEQSACSFMKSTQCCNNTQNSLNRNILDAGCANAIIDNLDQNIDSVDTKACDLSNQMSGGGEQDTNASETNDQESDESQTYNTALYVGGAIGCVVLLIILGVVGYFVIQSKTGGGGGMPIPPSPVSQALPVN